MSENGRGIKIGELMRRTGVTRATIHHYVREGLLPQPEKTSANMALYDPGCVDRVTLIKGLQHHQRRSLAEVKTLLAGAGDDEGLGRLQGLLEAEASRSEVSPLRPDRPIKPIGIKALCERTGFSQTEVREFESLGIISSRKVRGRRAYSPTDVDVADALAGLAQAGFGDVHGFEAQDVLIYVKALKALLTDEVQLFFEKARTGGNPEDLLPLAERGIELVTPLLLAIRRKLIREFIEAAPLSLGGKKR